jgi:hypothetical protein
MQERSNDWEARGGGGGGSHPGGPGMIMMMTCDENTGSMGDTSHRGAGNRQWISYVVRTLTRPSVKHLRQLSTTSVSASCPCQ